MLGKSNGLLTRGDAYGGCVRRLRGWDARSSRPLCRSRASTNRAAVFLLLFVPACSSSPDEEAVRRAALESGFQESMTGVALEGHFTLKGKEGIHPEYYEIEEISRMPGNYWLIHARIQYGDHDVTLPVPVRILWADDTPIITLTDAAIPGLGTFTARVLFHDGQYVGTWSSGDHGGQQFGRIVQRKSEK